jgi:polysaccharide export outer membrane protein
MNCFIFEEMKSTIRIKVRQFLGLIPLVFLFFAFFTACTPKKKILYFNQGSFLATPKPSQPLKCQPGDILEIKVYSVNSDVVAPFNSFLGAKSGNDGRGYNGYLISENFSVTLPLVGKIQVENLTLQEIESLIALQLGDYVKDPVVSVKIINFEVTVLGEVGSPGVVAVQNAQTNLIEVLGMAGDINLNGLREDILVIRNENGKRQEFHLDITQKGIFDQEGFYLHQNDVVYVSPNSSKRQSSALNPVRNSVILSLTTVMTSFFFSLIFK